MSEVVTCTQESSTGAWARNMRMALRLTQQELAGICGVSQEEIESFECNLPVKLDSKDKLLRRLRVTRNSLCQTFPR